MYMQPLQKEGSVLHLHRPELGFFVTGDTEAEQKRVHIWKLIVPTTFWYMVKKDL